MFVADLDGIFNVPGNTICSVGGMLLDFLRSWLCKVWSYSLLGFYTYKSDKNKSLYYRVWSQGAQLTGMQIFAVCVWHCILRIFLLYPLRVYWIVGVRGTFVINGKLLKGSLWCLGLELERSKCYKTVSMYWARGPLHISRYQIR